MLSGAGTCLPKYVRKKLSRMKRNNDWKYTHTHTHTHTHTYIVFFNVWERYRYSILEMNNK